MSRPREYQTYYSVGPILEIARIRSFARYGRCDCKTMALVLGIARETVSRWDKKEEEPMITVMVADKIACKLGLHLDIIWPNPATTKMFAR